MKNHGTNSGSFTLVKLQAIRLCLIAALVFTFALVSCDNGTTSGGGEGPLSVTYTGIKDSVTYTLKITENLNRAAYTPQAGDTYELTFSGKKSTGTVSSFDSGTFTLQPDNSEETFTATVSGNNLSNLSGTITCTDDSQPAGPGALTSGGGGEGGDTPAEILKDYPYLTTSWMGSTLEFYEPMWAIPNSFSDWPVRLSALEPPYRAVAKSITINGVSPIASIENSVINFQCNVPDAVKFDDISIYLNFTGSTGIVSTGPVKGVNLNWSFQRFEGLNWYEYGYYSLFHETFWFEVPFADYFLCEQEIYTYLAQDVSIANPTIISGKPGFTMRKGWHAIRVQVRYNKDKPWDLVSRKPRTNDAKTGLIWQLEAANNWKDNFLN